MDDREKLGVDMSKAQAIAVLGAAREGRAASMIEITSALWLTGDIRVSDDDSESEDHNCAY